MFDPKSQSIDELCTTVLTQAKQLGASGAEVSLVIDEGFSTTVRKGDVEVFTNHMQQSIDVTVYFEQKTGSASTTDFSLPAIEQTLSKACNIAKFTQDDPFAGLPDPDRLATTVPDCDLDHPWSIDAAQAIALAAQCEQAGLESDSRITNSDGATVSSNREHTFYANSLGFAKGYERTAHSVSATLIAKANEQMQRDFDYTYARDAADLNDVEALGRRVAERTVKRLGAKPIKTQSAPVIFRADLAAGLLGNLVQAISGSSVYRQASFLADSLGKPIFPEWFNIEQQPHIPKGIASKPFDSEGVATEALMFIQAGVLENFVLSSYSARKLKMATTGCAGGPQNLLVSHHDLDRDALLAEMGTGLFVTDLIGQGVNLVTGDYSRGAFGYWVEKGQIQFPVDGITIAGNLLDMFNNVRAIANDIETRRTVRTGSLLLDQMMIAGQ